MPNKRTNAVPERLAAARHSAGLTQEEVADRVGLSPTSITRYETGIVKPSTVSLKALANLYGKSFEWLQGEDEVPQAEFREQDGNYITDLELVLSEPNLALRARRGELSDEAIADIAEFIRFVRVRDERRKHEREDAS